MSASRLAARPNAVLYAAAALSLLAALIHLRVMPEHFEEWWGYGTFFLVLRRRPRSCTSRSCFAGRLDRFSCSA